MTIHTHTHTHMISDPTITYTTQSIYMYIWHATLQCQANVQTIECVIEVQLDDRMYTRTVGHELATLPAATHVYL